MNTSKVVGEAIRQARMRSGLRVSEAAERAGMSISRWRQIENGFEIRKGEKVPVRTMPERIARIALVVGLDPGDLLAMAGHQEVIGDTVPMSRWTGGALNTGGLDDLDLMRVQAYIDGIRAGKVRPDDNAGSAPHGGHSVTP